MSFTKYASWSSIFFLVLIVGFNYCQAANNEPKEKEMKIIHVKDLLKNVQIVGNFGKPLGELVTIQGTWIKPGGDVKDHTIQFHVDHIDGKELKEPIEFRPFQIREFFPKRTDEAPPSKSAEGDKWELVGIETLKFNPISNEVWEKIGIGRPSPLPNVYTEFQFITLKKLK
jgi:hypothetical protein